VAETSPTGRAPFQYSSIHLDMLLCRKISWPPVLCWQI